MTKSKKQIAKEYEHLTFSPMKNVQDRSAKELNKVLNYERSLRKRK